MGEKNHHLDRLPINCASSLGVSRDRSELLYSRQPSKRYNGRSAGRSEHQGKAGGATHRG